MSHILGKTIRFFSPLIFLMLISVNHEAVLWAQEIPWEYDVAASGKQQAEAMAVDSLGNTILTGFSESTSTDFFTAKVEADGSGLAWPAVSFDLAGGNDVATAVAVDANDDIIVTGYAHNGSHYDIQTIKYSGVDGSVIWQHTFDSEAHGDDRATAIAVDSLDNVYVGGYGQGSSGKNDFIILKYAPNGPNPDGTPTWDFTYNGPADGNDLITAIAAGIDGLAVTGKSQNATPDYDCLTFKLGFDKAFIWPQPQRYADIGDGEGRAVAMDGEGNVVMTGFVFDHVAAGSQKDLFTIKYEAADGTPLWVQPLDRGYDDEGRALYIDESGAVYVVGTTFSLSSATDVLTIKYDAAGAEQWSGGKLYNSANGNNDVGVAIVADEGGDLFVAGYSNDAVSGHDRILLLKYRKDNGTFLWNRLFVGNNEDNRTKGLGISPDGDVLVGGWSDRWTAGASDYDYYVIHYASGEINPPTDLSAETITNTEIALSWTDNSLNEENFILERKICTESTYNSVTVLPPGTGTGSTSYNSIGLTPDTRYCFRVKATNTTDGSSPYSNEADARTTVVSYEPPTWLYRFNGPDGGDDYPEDIATGPDGNPVLTGHSFSLAGAFDYLTVKLDRSDAAELWRARYDDPDFESDFATSVAVDSRGRVIVTGFASLYGGGSGNTNDVFTLGYQGDGLPLDADGNPVVLWSDQYNGPEGGDDRSSAVATATDGSDNSVVIGYGRNLQWNDDIYVIRYLPDGTRGWAATPYDGGGNDYPAAVGFDSAGDVFVGGYVDSGAGRDFFVAKYRGSDGAMIWKDTFSGSGNGDDYVEDLAVDAAGNLYVCGYSLNAAGNGDFYTIKYDGAGDGIPDVDGVFGGRVLWQQAYDGGGYDRAVGVRIDPVNGDVVVAGTTYVGPGNHDFHVIRYAPAGDGNGNGAAIWEKTLDRPTTDDAVASVDIDRAGTVCIVGTADGGNGSDMLTAKYDYRGTVVDATVYDGPAGSDDAPMDVAINVFGEAFVAGFSLNSAGNADYVVFKADGGPMQPPVPVSATQHYTEVDLSWTDNSLNEAGFRLERKVGACADPGFWTRLPDFLPGTTGFVDSGLNIDSTYCYRMQSFDASGEASRWIETEVATAAPTSPTDLAAVVLDTTSIELRWTVNTSTQGGFTLQRCQGPGCDFSVIDGSFDLSTGAAGFVDSTVCADRTYSYRVNAYQSGAWTSSWSNVAADITTPLPGAPDNLAVVGILENRVDLTWRDRSEDETAFVIERCPHPAASCLQDVDFVEIGTAPATPPGLLLHYRMDEPAWTGAVGEVIDNSGLGNHGRAYNGLSTAAGGLFGRAGAFDGSNDYIATAINIDQSAASPGATVQAWVRPEAGASAYRYVIGTDDGGSDWGLLLYGTYWYVSTGQSLWSTGLSVNYGQWQHVAAVFEPGVGVRFYRNGIEASTSVIDYDTSDANVRIGQSGLGNYFLGAIDEAAVHERPLSAAEIQAHYSGGIARYADQGVTHSTTYTYRVRAAKTGGCGWPTPYTGSVEAFTAPAPPDNLTATPLGTTQIRLKWQLHTVSETGFRILRCTGTGCADYSEIGTVGAGATEYLDDSVCTGAVYSYRVTALKTGEWETVPSEEVSASALSPVMPTGFTATGTSEERVELEWGYPDKDFSGFRLSRCQGDAAACAQDADFLPLTDLSGELAGLRLLYRMDEAFWGGTAGEVADSSGNGSNGTAYNGPTTVEEGKYGRSGDFSSASSQFVLTPLNLDQSASSAGATMEAWVYPTSTATGYRFVIGTDNGGYDWGLLQYGATWYVSTGNSFKSTGMTVTANQWQHIAAVFIPGTGVKFYKNGGAPVTISEIGYDTSDNNVNLGRQGTASYYFQGRIDEAAVYDRPLTDGEIADRYAIKIRLVDSGLPPGTAYSYRVEPYKTATCGWDGPYAEGSAATWDLLPPSDFAGRAYDTTRIDLSWTPTTTSETGFRLDHCPGTLIECLGDPGAVPPIVPSEVFDDPPLILSPGTELYSDTSVCAGTDHTYRVRAEPWPTDWAGPLQVSTSAPAEPGNFRIVGSTESEVALAWEDTNSDESEYVLERCLGDAASCPVETGIFAAVQTLGGTIPGRLLHFRMDEAVWSGAAGEVTDASGLNHHGQAFNGAVTDASGKYDRAGLFDGVNDYVATPLNIDQSAASAGATFEAWVYPTSSSTSYRYVFGTDNGGYDWGVLHYNSIWYLSTGTSRYSTGVALDLNQWQHIAAVFNPGTGIKFYKNGAEVKVFSTSYLGFDASAANVSIGRYGANGYYFAGRIDEAAVYDHPLALADIQRHFQLGVNRFGHTDSGLLPGATYTFRVGARKSASCPWASPFAAATVTTDSPPPPEDFTVSPVDTTSMSLSWTGPTTSETGFRIQRCTGAGCTDFADFVPPLVLNPDTQTHTDQSVCGNTSYGYQIRAENSDVPWVTTWVGPASATTPAPLPPANVQVIRLSEVELRLRWTAGTSDETGFTIERCAGAACSEFNVGAGVYEYYDDLLEPLVAYTYRVKAFKSAACGWETAFSDSVSVTTGVAGPDVSIGMVNTTEVVLTWTDTAVSESGYRIERCSGGGCADFTDLDPPVILPPDTTSYTDGTLCSGQTYGYRVQALARPFTLSNDGGGCWSRRRPITFTTFRENAGTFLTVAYDSDMRSDFGDLRFFDVKANRELSYWIREKTDGSQALVWLETGANSDIYMYYGNPNAIDAGDEAPFVTEYDNFSGKSFDPSKWTAINPRQALAQDDGLLLKDLGTDNWDTLLVSNRMLYRASNPILYFDVSIPADTAGLNAFMMGWYYSTTLISVNYARYMLHWNDYAFYWRESSSQADTAMDYTAGTDYEVKIDLKSVRGARYYVRGGAWADWTLLAETNSNADLLRIAVLQYSHEAVIHSVKLWEVADSGAASGAEEQAGCYGFGRSWDGAFGSAAWPTTTLPRDVGTLAVNAIGDNLVQLNWSDTNPDETGFEIERCIVGETCPAYSRLGVAGGGGVVFSDDSVQPSTNYSYRIRAFKTASCGWQTAYSNTASDATFPAAVGDLRVSALNSRSIRLEWTDLAADEEGYEIEIRAWNGRFVLLDAVEFDQNHYVDTVGIEPETEYRYRIRPFRDEDKSPYSNEAVVTTPSWQLGDGTCRP